MDELFGLKQEAKIVDEESARGDNSVDGKNTTVQQTTADVIAEKPAHAHHERN